MNDELPWGADEVAEPSPRFCIDCLRFEHAPGCPNEVLGTEDEE